MLYYASPHTLTVYWVLLQFATKAAECLTQMTAALAIEGSVVLPELVLADDQVVGDMLGCLSGPKQEGSQPADTHLQALASIIAAVSGHKRFASLLRGQH